jgi:hypothetical protein
LKKKKQKTVTPCAKPPVQMGKSGAALDRQKFFGSFFKKELLPSACLPLSVSGSQRGWY